MRLIERVRQINWAAIGFVAILFSPEIAAFSYIAVAGTKGERPEIALGVPGEYLERHGYILGKPGHFTPWVCEHLTKASFVERAKRDDFTFYADDDVPVEFRATLADYADSPFDRGHMAPARDMVHSAMAMRDAYRLSNMMPQAKGLNRGEWRRLEAHIAELASEVGAEVWVATGPAFLPRSHGALMKDGSSAEYDMEFRVIGAGHMLNLVNSDLIDLGGRLWVPSHCWKAAIVKCSGKYEAFAWLIPNDDDPPPFEKCEATIDDIERAAGLDLFSALPDAVEEALEAAK